MLTPDQMMNARDFEHVTEKNADGTPLRARRNGKTVTWKTRPGEFRIPCKYGLKQSFYIDQTTVQNWVATTQHPQ